jgi:hypothetical protein
MGAIQRSWLRQQKRWSPTSPPGLTSSKRNLRFSEGGGTQTPRGRSPRDYPLVFLHPKPYATLREVWEDWLYDRHLGWQRRAREKLQRDRKRRATIFYGGQLRTELGVDRNRERARERERTKRQERIAAGLTSKGTPRKGQGPKEHPWYRDR